MEINRIYNECNSKTMARMPNNFVDLTVTSPPYDNLRTYNGYSFDFEAVARELFRVTKKGGVAVWVVGDSVVKGSETGTSFRQALYFKEIGFDLHDTMIYRKANRPPLNHNRYEQEFEFMLVLSKGKPKSVNLLREECKNAGRINKGTARHDNNNLQPKHGLGMPHKDTKPLGNIWTYAVGAERDNKGRHPAVFPERLANDHIISWSNPGDLVYDPFLGSGTTAKMAIANGRNWIGSEVSEEYCKIAESRIKKSQGLFDVS